MRKRFRIEVDLPMTITVSDGSTIPNSIKKTIGSVNLKAGDTIGVTTEKSPNGLTVGRLSRANITFDSYEKAKHVSF